MKTIGIIGGMSYESSIHYYRRINDQVNARAGGLTCAELIIYNVNFGVIRQQMLEGRWDEIGTELSRIAKVLENAGADCVAIATNTMHKLAAQVQGSINVPLIHIADCVAAKCRAAGVDRVALLGTRYTMEQSFLSDRLRLNGIEAFAPAGAGQIDEIDRIIFDELCKGEIKDSSRDYFLSVIGQMEKELGIKGVILGCTEIEMLIKQKDLALPVFDTTQAHIDSLVDIALGE